jgi:hypothetical protein
MSEPQAPPVTKVSGTALIQEIRALRAATEQQNKILLRVLATLQSTTNTAAQVVRPPQQVPAPQPQQPANAHAAQIASMYPSMAGAGTPPATNFVPQPPTNGAEVPQSNLVSSRPLPTNNPGISGVEEPQWMNQPTPITNI